MNKILIRKVSKNKKIFQSLNQISNHKEGIDFSNGEKVVLNNFGLFFPFRTFDRFNFNNFDL